VYDDEVEEARIRDNYIFIMDNLYMALKERAEFTLGEFNAMMEKHYSADVLKNADYYSFFVNLCQKSHYTIGGTPENESFLDAYVSEAFEGAEAVEFEIEQGEGDVDDGSVGEYETERQDGDATDECFEIEFRNVIFKNLNYKI
jgi:hypothetical protein